MYRQVKFIWPLFAAVASFALNTTIVRSSGTIVVFGLSKNEIVVAADSRREDDAGKYDDHECKIIALSDKFAFVANGMVGLEGGSGSAQADNFRMDAREQARIAFDATHPDANDFVANVAGRWARDVVGRLKHAIAVAGVDAVLGTAKEGLLLQGFFFGASRNSDIVFYHVDITSTGNDVSFSPNPPQPLPLGDRLLYGGSGGIMDTVNELREGKTEWARTEAAQWERKATTLPKEDRDVLKAERWVQLTLDAHPKSPHIGGPIDSLTLTATGIRWHHRKPECRKQRPAPKRKSAIRNTEDQVRTAAIPASPWPTLLSAPPRSSSVPPPRLYASVLPRELLHCALPIALSEPG